MLNSVKMYAFEMCVLMMVAVWKQEYGVVLRPFGGVGHFKSAPAHSISPKGRV